MPNYYAHLTFGAAVYDHLSSGTVRRAVDRERQAFDTGLYGPDPLFFFLDGIIPSVISKEGHALHSGAPEVALERLRRPVEEKHPFALGYALGYLCHYLLDRACHPFVYENESRRGISHMAMEGEFDRFLMKRSGINPRKVTPLKRPEDKGVSEAAALAYRNVTPFTFRMSMTGFYRISHMLTVCQGSILCPVFDLFTCGSKTARGMLLHRKPNKHAEYTNAELLSRWEAAVEPAAETLEQVYEAYETGSPLTFLPRQNFKGQPLAQAG